MVTMTQNPQTQANAKLSTYLMMIIIIVVALAIVALLMAGILLFYGQSLAAGLLAIIGAFAIGLAVAVFYQTRRNATAMKKINPKVMTTIECKKCGTKTSREFLRGDYVFKEVEGTCQKCFDKQMISGIYREVLEKEKTYNV
jgi:hypothetical protein